MRKQSLAAFTLFLLSVHAGAATYSTDTLNISVYDWSFSSSPYWYPASYEILDDGVKFNTSAWIGGGNSGFPESAEMTFNVTDLEFLAKPGYQIAGYEFSFSGQVYVTEQASATVSGGLNGGGYQDTQYFYANNYWTPYTLSSSVAADNPAGGQVSVYGSLFFDAPYYYDYVYDDYGNIIDFVLYASGRADITLDSLSVRAFVTAVPEPETYLMFLAGLGAVAWRTRRAVGPWAAA
jgi:hypothetical protein